MSKARFVRAALLGVLYVVWAVPSFAQWQDRTITLEPGWNAVYLDVEPELTHPEDVFAGVPVEKVFVWYKRSTTVKFIDDPELLRPEQPEWLVYIPSDMPSRHKSTLVAMVSGYSYLIKIGGETAVDWVVRGQPRLVYPDWIPDSFNLVGFHVDPVIPPTFESLLGLSPAHAGQPVYRLAPEGHWEQVLDPATATVRRNEAFWVYTEGASNYTGPVELGLAYGTSLDFGAELNEATVTIANNALSQKTVFVTQLGSLGPAGTDYPALLGGISLGYQDTSVPFGERVWTPVSGPMAFNIDGGASLDLRLEVRRRDMPQTALPAGHTDGLFQDILQIRDGEGSLYYLGVASEGLQPQSAIAKALKRGKSLPNPRAGLWVGTAEITAVAHLNKPFVRDALIEAARELLAEFDALDGDGDGMLTYAEALPGRDDLTRTTLEQLDLNFNDYITTSELNTIISSQQGLPGSSGSGGDDFPPVPVADGSQFLFKIILHVDDTGAVRLLRHVTKMWRTPDRSVEDDQGEFVLISSDELLRNIPAWDDGRPRFIGTNPRDNKGAGGRVSTNAFAFNDPVLMSGSFPWDESAASGYLDATVVLPYNDPLNPFLHKFNPDHDNLGADGKPYGWQAVAANVLYEGFGTLPHADATGFTLAEAQHATSDLDYGMTQGLFGMIDGNADGLLSETELEFLASMPQDGSGIESFTVTRHISMDFKDADECPECGTTTSLPGWGDTLLAGHYFEEIEGLHKPLGPITEPENQVGIKISGAFVLRRISTIGSLTDAV